MAEEGTPKLPSPADDPAPEMADSFNPEGSVKVAEKVWDGIRAQLEKKGINLVDTKVHPHLQAVADHLNRIRQVAKEYKTTPDPSERERKKDSIRQLLKELSGEIKQKVEEQTREYQIAIPA